MDVQMALGADIIMAFDECTEYPADRTRARQSLELTLRWARRSQQHFNTHTNGGQSLFGIVQGGMYPGSAPRVLPNSWSPWISPATPSAG